MIEPAKLWEIANDRVDYRLTFRATKKKRPYKDRGTLLDSDPIPCAETPRHPLRASVSSWSSDPDMEPKDVREWIEHYFTMAVSEAVHEVLEWFRVDGERYVNPHDVGVEMKIVDRSCRLAKDIIKLKDKQVQG